MASYRTGFILTFTVNKCSDESVGVHQTNDRILNAYLCPQVQDV
jgi:hypothetical protein